MKRLVIVVVAMLPVLSQAGWAGFPWGDADWNLLRVTATNPVIQLWNAKVERAQLLPTPSGYEQSNVTFTAYYIASYTNAVITTNGWTYTNHIAQMGTYTTNFSLWGNTNLVFVSEPISATNEDGSPNSITLPLPLDGSLITVPDGQIFGYYGDIPVHYFVLTNEATGGNFNGFFSRTNNPGNSYLSPYPDFLIFATPGRIFSNELGAAYGQCQQSFWGVDSETRFIFFARGAPQSVLLAQASCTNYAGGTGAGWVSRSYGDIPWSSLTGAQTNNGSLPLILSLPVLLYQPAPSQSIPNITAKLEGRTSVDTPPYYLDGDSEQVNVAPTVSLGKCWLKVTNFFFYAPGNTNDSITVEYTNRSVQYMSSGAPYYETPKYDVLNARLFNQDQKVLNTLRWVQQGGSFFTVAKSWHGWSTNSWAEAMANCIENDSGTNWSYDGSDGRPAYGTDATTTSTNQGNGNIGAFTAGLNVSGRWHAYASNSLSYPIVSWYLGANVTNYAHDVDFYFAFNAITNLFPQLLHPDQTFYVDWQDSPTTGTTNMFSLCPAFGIAGTYQVNQTNTASSLGTLSIPPNWHDASTSSYVCGWKKADSTEPALIYRFDVSGGFQYQ